MSDLSRRGFVGRVAVTGALPVLGADAVAAVAALPVPETAAGAPPTTVTGQPGSLDPTLLRAVAEAVLPAELGEQGLTVAIADFRQWAAGYAPAVERVHGYGTAELEYTPADPVPGWSAQLRALDLEARARHGTGFAALARAARDALIRGAIGSERALPAAQDARHVALAVLAHFLATPRAIDLCHRARIGRHGCRPLGASPERPAALED
jgi:hypothetical protein